MNNRGFGLTEILIAMGLLAAIALGFSQMFVNTAVQQSRANAHFALDQTRRNLSTILGNVDHWTATISGNAVTSVAANADSHLACLSSALGAGKPNCDHDAAMPFAIYTVGGVKFFDPSTQGFTMGGEICDLQPQNPQCLLKLDLVVKTKCAPTGAPPTPPANCATPSEVLVHGLFAPIAGSDQTNVGPFNPANYAIVVRKDLTAAAASTSAPPFRVGCAYHSGYMTPPYNQKVCTPGGGPCSALACPTGYNKLTDSEEATVGATNGIICTHFVYCAAP